MISCAFRKFACFNEKILGLADNSEIRSENGIDLIRADMDMNQFLTGKAILPVRNFQRSVSRGRHITDSGAYCNEKIGLFYPLHQFWIRCETELADIIRMGIVKTVRTAK